MDYRARASQLHGLLLIENLSDRQLEEFSAVSALICAEIGTELSSENTTLFYEFVGLLVKLPVGLKQTEIMRDALISLLLKQGFIENLHTTLIKGYHIHPHVISLLACSRLPQVAAIVQELGIQPILMCERPTKWIPQSQCCEIVPIERGSAEWIEISELCHHSCGPRKVVSAVERIQNLYQWRKFVQARELLTLKNGPSDVNEVRLFHGTKNTPPSAIYSGEEGFDPRFSKRGAWGIAAYFSVSSWYSINGYGYSKPKANHQVQIFVARVLLGISAQLKINESLTIPPIRPGRSALFGDRTLFDSVHGQTFAGAHDMVDVYMLYTNTGSYPEYLITLDDTKN